MMGEKGIMTSGTYGRNPKVYLNSGEIILPDYDDNEDKMNKIIINAICI